MKRFVALAALALLLCACILVDDFGKAWDEATPDMCVSKIAESLYYAEFRRDPEKKDMDTLAHAWTVGGQHYLLLKKDVTDKGGRMYRFQVTNGIFQRFRLNPTMRAQFEKDYPNAPVSLARDTVTLKALNADTIKLLTEIGSKADYWEIEDQTLYNTILNPECRFEDRDLNAIKNEGKKK